MAIAHHTVQHNVTQERIATFLAQPSQTLLISGPAGIGKSTLAKDIAASLLVVDRERLDSHPYLTVIDDTDSSISIDTVRQLLGSLTRKLPGSNQRIIIIEAADRLSDEAQNALLKSLEEPPERTTWLLTAHNPRSLLPTVRSRMSELHMIRPELSQTEQFFTEQGFTAQAVQRAQLMSGGLPGLMTALLHEDTAHPLVAASEVARLLIQADRFQRLTMVDSLAKDRPQALAVMEILQAMAHVSIAKGSQPERWRSVLTAAYDAAESLQQNGQPKLTLTNLMLDL